MTCSGRRADGSQVPVFELIALRIDSVSACKHHTWPHATQRSARKPVWRRSASTPRWTTEPPVLPLQLSSHATAVVSASKHAQGESTVAGVAAIARGCQHDCHDHGRCDRNAAIAPWRNQMRGPHAGAHTANGDGKRRGESLDVGDDNACTTRGWEMTSPFRSTSGHRSRSRPCRDRHRCQSARSRQRPRLMGGGLPWAQYAAVGMTWRITAGFRFRIALAVFWATHSGRAA